MADDDGSNIADAVSGGTGDSFQDVTSQSWGGGVGNSCMGAILGLILFFGSFILLSWNEGRSVHEIRNLDEGERLVISVPAAQPDPTNQNKLIYTTGQTATNDVLSDTSFNFNLNALQLNRIVQMYQWKEKSESKTEKKLGGGSETVTNYTYTKEWSEAALPSNAFKHPEGHANPPMQLSSAHYAAQTVALGGFYLTQPFISQISNTEPYPLNAQTYAMMAPAWQASFKLNGSEYYMGADPANPAIGDMKVAFTFIRPVQVISVIGKQDSGRITPYYTKNGVINLLSLGSVDPTSMFVHAKHTNMLMTWGLRAGGWFMMFLGLTLMMSPLSAIANVIPMLGGLIGFGSSALAGIVSFFLSVVTIAIAWFVYRPLLALLLVGGAVAVIAGLIVHRKKSKLA